jgi:hypothetical protein
MQKQSETDRPPRERSLLRHSCVSENSMVSQHRARAAPALPPPRTRSGDAITSYVALSNSTSRCYGGSAESASSTRVRGSANRAAGGTPLQRLKSRHEDHGARTPNFDDRYGRRDEVPCLAASQPVDMISEESGSDPSPVCWSSRRSREKGFTSTQEAGHDGEGRKATRGLVRPASTRRAGSSDRLLRHEPVHGP